MSGNSTTRRIPFKQLSPVAKVWRIMETCRLGQPGAKEYGISATAGPGPDPEREDNGR